MSLFTNRHRFGLESSCFVFLNSAILSFPNPSFFYPQAMKVLLQPAKI